MFATKCPKTKLLIASECAWEQNVYSLTLNCTFAFRCNSITTTHSGDRQEKKIVYLDQPTNYKIIKNKLSRFLSIGTCGETEIIDIGSLVAGRTESAISCIFNNLK